MLNLEQSLQYFAHSDLDKPKSALINLYYAYKATNI